MAAYPEDSLFPERSLPPVLVTASRDGLAPADVESALQPHFAPGRVLISGGARGGDRMAEELWQAWGGEVDRHAVSPEAWQRSAGAGFARNAEMVAAARQRGGEVVAIIARCGRPDHAGLAPHGSHGTVHCADIAGEAGLRVDRVKAGADVQAGASGEPAARRHGRYYPPEMALPEGICPGCRSAALNGDRATCQACGVSAALPAEPQPVASYRDLSHGQPGHMCVLPGGEGAQREAEAGQ
jgi:hypothetical protein